MDASNQAPQAGCKEGVAIRRVIKINDNDNQQGFWTASTRAEHTKEWQYYSSSSRKEDREYTTQAWAVVPPGKTALVVWKV